MHRKYRRMIATGVLALVLVVATPLTAEARWFELERHERVASGPSEEATGWWVRIRTALDSLWSKSVFIIPEGGPGAGNGNG